MYNDNSKSNNFTNLNNQIHNIQTELVLNSDTINNDEEIDYLMITKDDITIDGNNYCIDANGKSGIFKIKADNVTLKNIIFKNAKSSAIINEEGLLNMFNCKFINNESTTSGGAIYNENVIKGFDCKFIDNCSNEFGGAIFNEELSFFKNCHFENNHSENDGGAINNQNAVKILDSEFIDNSSSQCGGSIYSYGLVDLYRCEFKENNANACGGAVKNDYFLRVWDCRFEKNASEAHGGSIYCQNDTLSIVDGCEFVQNFAKGNGGAATTNGFIKFENSRFTENISKNCGGALRADKEGYLFIDASIEFLDNAAEMGDAYSFYSPKNINDETEGLQAFHADYFCIPIDR